MDHCRLLAWNQSLRSHLGIQGTTVNTRRCCCFHLCRPPIKSPITPSHTRAPGALLPLLLPSTSPPFTHTRNRPLIITPLASNKPSNSLHHLSFFQICHSDQQDSSFIFQLGILAGYMPVDCAALGFTFLYGFAILFFILTTTGTGLFVFCR